jgi:hypothetical protein
MLPQTRLPIKTSKLFIILISQVLPILRQKTEEIY